MTKIFLIAKNNVDEQIIFFKAQAICLDGLKNRQKIVE